MLLVEVMLLVCALDDVIYIVLMRGLNETSSGAAYEM